MRVAALLRARGVNVTARHLGDRLPAEVMRAQAWAELGESDRLLPIWLRPFAKMTDASEPDRSEAEQLALYDNERTTP